RRDVFRAPPEARHLAGRMPRRRRAAANPADRSLRPADAERVDALLLTSRQLLHPRDHARPVLGLHRFRPRVGDRVGMVTRLTEDLLIGGTDVDRPARGRVANEEHLTHVLGELAEAGLALAQRLLGPSAGGDVGDEALEVAR